MRRHVRSVNGFTLIEMAIAVGVLTILTLVMGSLLLRTVDTYGQIASDTETIKQGRQCLAMISREIRESVNFVMSDLTTPADPLTPVQDALLLWSARQSENLSVFPKKHRDFVVDGNDNPVVSSIILFYLNTTPEGIPQLMRHQLYFDEDLSAFTEPFVLQAGNPYVGSNIVIVDGAGTAINIDRATGAVNTTPPYESPRILMNGAVSFDVVDDGIDPPEARIICQTTDRFNRTAMTPLNTQVGPRNL